MFRLHSSNILVQKILIRLIGIDVDFFSPTCYTIRLKIA